MQPPYKHLNEEVMAEEKPGIWVPAIPIPFRRGLFRPEFECACGQKFSSYARYCFHYRTEQLLEMNKGLGVRANLSSAKALFWRRAAFIYRYGSPSEISQLDALGTPEMKNYAQVNNLNSVMMLIWEPIYESVIKNKNATVHEMVEQSELIDETPQQAKADFAEPYTHVNSFGVTYYLNMKPVMLRGNKPVDIYFFSKEFKPEFAQRSLPDDKRVSENPRNGFLCVVRK